MVRQANAAPRSRSARAQSIAIGNVEHRQCSASAAASGTVAVSTGSTNISVSQNACPP